MLWERMQVNKFLDIKSIQLEMRGKYVIYRLQERTYCNVDSKARKFPSFPADQRLISTSSVSAIL